MLYTYKRPSIVFMDSNLIPIPGLCLNNDRSALDCGCQANAGWEPTFEIQFIGF